ncbi:uncharacterized protein [Amphiura filiformis]|uniref:uncharacterized protein n=1 Tax=Amphiura filiformis TaxID=82378 RepID=UPI003B21C3E8
MLRPSALSHKSTSVSRKTTSKTQAKMAEMEETTDIVTTAETNSTTTGGGIDYAHMGKMMSFTFGAVCFVLVLLLLDLYDRKCSGYVRAKLCSRSSRSSEDAKEGPKNMDPRVEEADDVNSPLQECKPSTSTSAC